jgi:hypothetical protein
LHLPSPEFPCEVLAFIVFCIAAQAHNPLQPVRISADEKNFFCAELPARSKTGMLRIRRIFFIADIKTYP